MFFTLSKIFWLVAQPLAVVMLLLLAGLALSFTGKRRLMRTCFGLAVVTLGLCAFTNFGEVLIAPLERSFAVPQVPPAEVDGIIVLGGGFDGEVSQARQGFELNASGDRFSEALRLALRYPRAKVLVSGGVGSLSGAGDGDAVVASRFFPAFGIAPERLLLDPQSRNTAENADSTKALVGQASGTWLLVTSAYHMPRSVGLFRRAGINAVPWPVDHRATGQRWLRPALLAPAENLALATTALREWAGLIAYWATGKIAEPLPGPVDTP